MLDKNILDKPILEIMILDEVLFSRLKVVCLDLFFILFVYMFPWWNYVQIQC